MTGNDAVLRMIAALEAGGVPYMLVGSYSSNAYGVARATQDADFVVQLPADAVVRLRTELGAEFRFDPQMSFETVTATTRHIVHVVGSHFKIELFLLRDDAYARERFARRREENYLGRRVFLPTPEDVVVTKLRWSRQGKRPKDLDDARNVIAVQGNRLDWDYMHRWCEVHGTRGLLDELRRSIPPELWNVPPEE
ncbi:MAG: hypothetical protein AB1716_06165 [Planctomycetota bacterium]